MIGGAALAPADRCRERGEATVNAEIHSILDGVEEVDALLVEAVSSSPSLVLAASPSYLRLMGCASREDLVGKSVHEVLTRGSPSVSISRSGIKDVDSYCSACSRTDVEQLSLISTVQPCLLGDGTHHTNLYVFGMHEVQHRRYVLVVRRSLGEGLCLRITAEERAKVAEVGRALLLRLQSQLLPAAAGAAEETDIEASTGTDAAPAESQVPFRFYSGRLQDHCLLSNGGRTVVRREPEELPSGCLVFSDRPVERSSMGSRRFTVRVESVTGGFTGLPLLGFTQRRPEDAPGLYPQVSTCMGSSLLIGTGGCAYARDQQAHFKVGFKRPPDAEVARLSCPVVSLEGSKVVPGDLLTCIYSQNGHIQMLCNEETVMECETGKPPAEGAEYFAVIDCCLSISGLSILPCGEAASTTALVAGAEGASGSLVRTLCEGLTSAPIQCRAQFAPSSRSSSASSYRCGAATASTWSTQSTHSELEVVPALVRRDACYDDCAQSTHSELEALVIHPSPRTSQCELEPPMEADFSEESSPCTLRDFKSWSQQQSLSDRSASAEGREVHCGGEGDKHFRNMMMSEGSDIFEVADTWDKVRAAVRDAALVGATTTLGVFVGLAFLRR